ncbi:MAG: zeta toxin family protein [Planctomycetes bacterium]|nr:zeta toxin family protein [Planctomycetota bacterium]
MPELASPSVLAFAGCNGAGKSTSAEVMLPSYAGIETFVNADIIARGLSAFNPEGMAISAARLMLARLEELAAKRANFAFETTLSGKTYVPWLKDLRSQGYRFHLMYMWLDSPELAIRRVAERVSKGGHHIPEETIRRRYVASIRNFFNLYRPIADYWRLYDNSSESSYVLVASGCDTRETILHHEIWAQVVRSADDAKTESP